MINWGRDSWIGGEEELERSLAAQDRRDDLRWLRAPLRYERGFAMGKFP